jgi:hypothetical protein
MPPRNLKQAAHQAYLAHGHSQHALLHDAEGARLFAEQCDGLATSVLEQVGDEKTAA